MTIQITVGQAFDALDFTLGENETVCIASLLNGRWQERSLHAVRDEPVGANRYFSTGTFQRDQKWQRDNGRQGKNVRRVLAVPFDFDFKDLLRVDKRELFALTDEELEIYIQPLQASVEELFQEVGLPIHRLDYTGYGLAAQVRVAPHPVEAVPNFRRYNAAIVAKLNGLFGGVIADRQVADAGTRVVRLVPCLNVAMERDGNPVRPRQSRNLFCQPGTVEEAQLEAVAGSIVRGPAKVTIPEGGAGLTEEEERAVVVAYAPFHQVGQKHFLALAIAGQLGKAGVPEDQALRIVSEIARDDAKPWDRAQAVRETYERLRAGVSVSGYSRLRGVVPETVIAKVDSTLARLRGVERPRVVLPIKEETPAEPAMVFRPPLPPEAAFYGWHGRYRDLVAPTTEAADAFHIGASLAWQGALMGRRISTRYAGDQVFPSMYHCLVGPTGNSRKDTAAKRILSLPGIAARLDHYAIAQEYRQITDIGSREALIGMLARHPTLLLFASEIVSLFKHASRDATSTLLDGLITAWDTPSFMHNNTLKAQDAEVSVARDPFMVILGGIQPERLAREMTETMTASGLGNRMAFFLGVGKGRIPRTPDWDERAAGELYTELTRTIHQYQRGAELRMDAEAGERWDAWYLAIVEEEAEVANDMKIRHADMIQKWALCFAVSDGARAIGLPHLEAAIALCEWMWRCVVTVLPGWGAGDERKIEERILTVLGQRQPMTKRDLNRYVRGRWTATQFAKVFRAMEENEQVVWDVTRRFVSLPPTDG